MTDYPEFCDCYWRNHHSDEFVAYPCDYCEKMERMFAEENEECKTEIIEEIPDMVANF